MAFAKQVSKSFVYGISVAATLIFSLQYIKEQKQVQL